jgi:hypothetical protein
MTDRTTESGVADRLDERSEEDTSLRSWPRRRFLHGVAGAGGAWALLSAGTGTAVAGDIGAANAGKTEAKNGDEDEESDGDDGSQAISDVEALNFALGLEHLEAAYYNDFLDEYDEWDVEGSAVAKTFADPGSRYSTYQRIQQVRDHEEAHVKALTETIEDLGGDPVEPAEYDFPYESVAEFAELSATIEAVGVSAYAGVAPAIEADDVLEAALSIHSVEARHTAYFRVLDGTTPFPEAFDDPRTMEEVLDIVSRFIVGEDPETEEDDGDGENGDENEDGADDEGDDSGEEDGDDGDGRLSLAGLQAATGSGSNPTEEYVRYENTGDGSLDLTGWTVTNGRGTTYEFPDGFTLAPGETVTLYTGRGADAEGELYWGRPEEVWNDRIDTMTVRNAEGAVVLQRSYP